ncbi:hypothetical protein [Occultella gossypii]|uniref:Uncharacterized protein n=1 Tax=Occultella gossypii TaxID=2800820 RepID=A0ABS7SDC4_9MICO|nr:hypothetical protein [Occultella gossypii]MBZ2197261.1 hypothetical protein [Occultella gossypii]
MTTLTLAIPAPWWLSSNQRIHRMQVAGRTKIIRAAAARAARTIGRTFEQVHVCAFIQYPTAAKADPPNAWPTVKAMLDGLTDAGIWEDDDSKHVIATEFRREVGKSPRGEYRVRLVLTDQDVPFAAQNTILRDLLVHRGMPDAQIDLCLGGAS